MPDMNYQTFQPHPDLAAFVKCFWILEVPAGMEAPKQRIVPDGCIEMFFILGDDVKRYTSDNDYIIQPRAMVFGQITKPFYIKPTGYVDTFAVCFYPYGFANFVDVPIQDLANKETPIATLFEEHYATELTQKVIAAKKTDERIKIIESFLLNRLRDQSTIDQIVKSTIDALLQTKGSKSIQSILKDERPKRRNMERKFSKLVGISPKQLGKVVRLQASLKMLLNRQVKDLTRIAYENEYYDQAHFIKDFKDFTGINPGDYLNDDQMLLSSLIYSKE